MRTPLLLCLLALCAAPRIMAQTLIHFYDFNGTAVTDLAGSQNGTLLGGAVIADGLLRLDGIDDAVVFATALLPTDSTSWSVAFFVQRPVAQIGHTEFISQGGPGLNFYIGENPSHNIRLSDSIIDSGVAFPTDGLRHHFALTVDFSANRINFYIDGTVALSVNGTLTPGIDVTNLGRQFGSHGEFFQGTLDNVQVYRGALSAAQVSSIALAVPEPSATALLLLGLGGFAACSWRRRA